MNTSAAQRRSSTGHDVGFGRILAIQGKSLSSDPGTFAAGLASPGIKSFLGSGASVTDAAIALLQARQAVSNDAATVTHSVRSSLQDLGRQITIGHPALKRGVMLKYPHGADQFATNDGHTRGRAPGA